MNKLQQALEAGEFGITAEMAPPKGCDFSHALEVSETLRGRVHCINVTDFQSSSLKASSIDFALN
jgi:hypothetical protein